MAGTLSARSGKRRFGWMDALFAVTTVLMVVNFYLIFLWVPKEAVQGNVQRIFYLHLPVAWIAYLAFFLVFIFSVLHLRKRSGRWDRWAYSSAELGVVFTSVTIVSGIIWAKPIFGVWWTWDARLTTTALLWLIYVGYLMVGAYSESPEKSSRLRAAVGILGFVVVPINYLSVYLWDTVHVEPIIGGGEESFLSSEMYTTLMFSLFTFTLLFFVLLKVRVMLRSSEETITRIASD